MRQACAPMLTPSRRSATLVRVHILLLLRRCEWWEEGSEPSNRGRHKKIDCCLCLSCDAKISLGGYMASAFISAGHAGRRASRYADGACNRGGMPLSGSVLTWGEEVYFEVPVRRIARKMPAPSSRPARSPIGPRARHRDRLRRTPVSQADETRLASPCNIWAKALGDVKTIAAVRAAAKST